jgi:D-sedoheptulose 7-phosphate isomerase
MNMSFEDDMNEHINICRTMLQAKLDIDHIAETIYTTLVAGNKLILCGNGGSAADCQHIAAEFTGRFVVERRALNAIALTTDTSALTAIANDYGYDEVFARQLKGVGAAGDLLVGISTSGASPNIIRAFEIAKNMNIKTLCLTGEKTGKLNELSDFNISVPSRTTARIQELHIFTLHSICRYIDEKF